MELSPLTRIGFLPKLGLASEEAVAQVRLRAERLGLADAPVQLAAETSVEDIIAVDDVEGELQGVGHGWACE